MSYKIRAFVYVVIATSIIGTSGCRKNSAPDAPSMPATNTYSSIDTSWVDSTTCFYTSATDPEKEDVSYQFYWDDGTTSAWSEYFKSGDIIKMNYTYTISDTYAVKVKSRDIHKNESEWSQALVLKVLTKSAAPESVTIVPVIDTGVIEVSVQFVVRAVDPENDRVTFMCKWSLADSGWDTTTVASGAMDTLTHIYKETGLFVIKAKAKDRQGSVSVWSLPCSVTIVPPKKPPKPDVPIALEGPYIERFMHTPYWFYNQVIKSTPPTTIQFNWGNDSSLSVVGSVWDSITVITQLQNAYTTTGTFNVTTNAFDNWGQCSDTSASLAITISDNFVSCWDTDTCLGMAIYKDTLWVVDWTNHQVKMFNTAGVLLGTIGANTLKAPKYVAVDSSCVYVTDASTAFDEIHKIYVFNKNGTIKDTIGGKGSGENSEGKFYYPTGIAVDTGFIYVVDSFNKRIQKFTKTGTYVSKWGISAEAMGMKIYDNELYVAFHKGDAVQVFSTEGIYIRNIGTNAITAGKELDADGCLSVPCDVAVTADAVYVVEASHKSNNNRVQKFSKTGAFVNRWGEKGIANGQFKSPQGIVVDDAGNIYIVDTGNCRIQVFRP
ncbi:MAG: 6-bladed beta-propeller [bacterium]